MSADPKVVAARYRARTARFELERVAFNPAVGKALLTACASSSTCRRGTAKALRFPGALVDSWYDTVAELRDEMADGMLTDGQEKAFRKLSNVMMKLGRLQMAPLDMLADVLEGMNNDEAEVLAKLVG